MSGKAYKEPNWDRLYEIAAGQGGYFATRQAAEAGYSVQLLRKHVSAGRVMRARRGVYRLVHFPPGEHEDLMVLWLWSERTGVFSHETALALLDLSDALPARTHMTLPAEWSGRRLRTPKSLSLYYGDVGRSERTWAGVVPVTAGARTIADCIAERVQPDLIRQAIDQAVRRGIVTREVARTLREELNRRRRAA